MKKWINEKEVSEMTGRGVQTLRNDRFKGQGIPYSKVGKSVRYSIQDVEAFMLKGKVQTCDISN